LTGLNEAALRAGNAGLGRGGARATGISVWESKSRAEAFYTAEWKQFVTRQYGAAPEIVYLHTPVMVDSTVGRIVIDGE